MINLASSGARRLSRASTRNPAKPFITPNSSLDCFAPPAPSAAPCVRPGGSDIIVPGPLCFSGIACENGLLLQRFSYFLFHRIDRRRQASATVLIVINQD